MYNLEVLALGALSILLPSVSGSSAFNPGAYQKSTATCKATNRAEGKETTVDIDLRNSRLDFFVSSF
jgi:hypothetical protein